MSLGDKERRGTMLATREKRRVNRTKPKNLKVLSRMRHGGPPSRCQSSTFIDLSLTFRSGVQVATRHVRVLPSWLHFSYNTTPWRLSIDLSLPFPLAFLSIRGCELRACRPSNRIVWSVRGAVDTPDPSWLLSSSPPQSSFSSTSHSTSMLLHYAR